MFADREIAEVLRQLDGYDLVVVRGLGIAEIGRPEQPERAARQGLHETLRRVELQQTAWGGVSDRLGWV